VLLAPTTLPSPSFPLISVAISSVRVTQPVEPSPTDFVIEDWVRDPYISIVGALELAIENALNMSNIMAIDCAPNPKEK